MKMYEDIGKEVKDLLEEDYFYSQRLKIKTKNASDLLWVTEGELSSKGATASISASRKGSTLSLDKFRVKSDGRVLIEASLITSKASKFTMKAEDGRQEPGKPLQSFGKLGCEFKMPSTYATADIDVVNGPIFKSSIVYNFSPSISFGGGTVVNTHLEEKNQSPELTDFSMAASYKGPDWNLTGKTLDSFGLLRLSYLHNVSPKLTVGSQLDYRIKGNSQKLSVGAKYLLDENSTVKTRIDSNAILASSFSHNLSKYVRMTLCGEVDIKDWSADSHKFGIGLTFE